MRNLPETEPGHRAPQVAADALDVLDTFRALGKTERERVQGFVYDAAVRQNEPVQEATFAALETFAAFVGAVLGGVGQEATCSDFGISPAQYARYRAAWETVRTLKEEADAACFAGSEAEEQQET